LKISSKSSTKIPSDRIDSEHMDAAMALAGRGLGRVAPNPAVGCVIVKDGRVAGRGWTQPGGRPHAETEALNRAGPAARGATAYVTLEPCAHHGQTPPCAEALIEAGIARCVVALEDPDPRVAGAGLTRLRDAGIEVAVGLGGAAAADLNAGYLSNRNERRPLVTLKLATTLDGRIATKRGDSRWITGPAARARAHLLRARHDAVLIGSGTAVADNPRLDVRLDGLEAAAPLRVVLDGRLRLPLTHDLVTRAKEQPSWLMTHEDGPRERIEAYRTAGVEVIPIAADEGGNLSVSAALAVLAERGVTRLLIEGGGHVAAAFLRARLIDRLVWFHAPKVIGGDGVPAVAGFGLDELAEAPGFALQDSHRIGEDLVESYARIA
jgi:diaminohydroxyphosphoribosylaminopyrimidine deaminase/5-amino-6-(5-phosphoribosylamino)uracil reductase